MGIKKKGSPIFQKILILMSILIGIEIILLIGFIFASNVTTHLNENAKDILDERVINRRNYLENEMVLTWSNIDMAVSAINATTDSLVKNGNLIIDQLDDSSQNAEELMNQITDNLISVLRNNRVTGVFVVFNTDNLDSVEKMSNKPGIYIRDLDPTSQYSNENLDLLIERAPASVIQKLGIPTDSGWRPDFEFKNKKEFYPFLYEPFQSAFLNQNLSNNYADHGYWSKGYTLDADERDVFSYSVPLILEDGTVYGIMGIDITFDYLKKTLPYKELFEDKLGSYILAVKEKNSDTYEKIFAHGSIYSQYAEEPLTTALTETSDKADWMNSEEDTFYYAVQELHLYNSNTPFSNEQWFLVGTVRTMDLFAFSNQILITLMMAIGLTLAAGIMGSFFISKIVSRPISMLYSNINTMQPGKAIELKRTGIMEIDRLASAIEILNQEVIDSATKFTQIIEMSSIRMGGFEIHSKEGTLFITEGFFDILGIQKTCTDVETFKNIMEELTPCIISREEGEILFCPPTHSITYVKLKYMENEEKYIGIVEDVTQSVLEKDRIRYERDHDLLTGLINRRAFYKKMHELFYTHPDLLKISALVMLDLDNLKNLNDTFGHDCGDKYIFSAAESFRNHVPEDTIVSRISGDEFYVFFYGYETKQEIQILLDQLKEGISGQTIMLPNQEKCHIKVSGGVAWYPDDSISYEELLKYSDFAMYKTKQRFKGEMSEFDIGMYNQEIYLLQNKAELNAFLEKALVHYHFQPIVDSSTGEIFAYEALMRPQTPNLRTPDDILTLARLEAKLNQVEILTWTKSLEAYESYLQENLIEDGCKIFINSIANQPILPESINIIEKRFGSYLNNIVLEVTENEKMDENILLHKKMMLKRWNASIALDDYGSGYNSEKNLLSLSPEFIKIDMEIVQNIDQDVDKQKVVENIISYAHERGMKLIAEGIETESEAKKVVSMGVDYLQGYFLAKPALRPPVISDEVKDFLKNLAVSNLTMP